MLFILRENKVIGFLKFMVIFLVIESIKVVLFMVGWVVIIIKLDFCYLEVILFSLVYLFFNLFRLLVCVVVFWICL